MAGSFRLCRESAAGLRFEVSQGMNWAADGIIDFLTFLLPGFVAAALFHSLRPHTKPGAFERVIQALIFTTAIKAITEPLAGSENWEPGLSFAVAVVLALIVACVLNNDLMHKFFRGLGITRETSYPTEWYSSFSRHKNCYVVLHLKGQRRLYGWPHEWPSRPEGGHFRIILGEWLVEDERIPVTGVEATIIPVHEVEMVELVDQHYKQEDNHG